MFCYKDHIEEQYKISNIIFDDAIFDDKLYLTSLGGVKKIKQIKELEIDIIISIMDENPFVDDNKNFINYTEEYKDIEKIFFKASDEEDFDISVFFEPFHKIINENPNKKILLHCYAGISRSPTLILSYMISKNIENYTLHELIKKLKKCRFIIDPNEGFIESLKNYIIKFQK
uniref:Tyrosine specific protein phosphatases domain-containing protein n=1 Tax=viral metagenome TaxID=1070528 RepID=A0A6C0AF65_9ZZZZ